MKLKEIPGALLTQFSLATLSTRQLLCTDRKRVQVIVSLTTIPSRLGYVHLAIRSLLRQSVLPEKIILWLNVDLIQAVPQKLSQLQGDLFEIRRSPLKCSHRKLVHSLDAFPEKVIVTCDDDGMYEQKWLENLYNEHLEHPTEIITNRCHFISYDEKGNTLPYRQWMKVRHTGFSSPALMPAGYGGVLYPPGSFIDEVTNQDLFMKLTPSADDLWFKAMSYLNGTLCRRSSTPGEKPVTILGTQAVRLGHTNIRLDQNREQWNALLEHFKFKTPEPDTSLKNASIQ